MQMFPNVLYQSFFEIKLSNKNARFFENCIPAIYILNLKKEMQCSV